MMRKKEQDIGVSDGPDDEDEEVKGDDDEPREEKMNFMTKLYEDEKFQKEKVLLEQQIMQAT